MIRIFSRLLDRVLILSKHPNAPWYLGALSFAESSFFPIPPDVMLAPMVLAQPEKAWRLATLTTVSSVLGGLAGYLIGVLAIEAVMPLLTNLGYVDKFTLAQDWFERWGFWAILAAGFSPIPYKIFTIAAGAMSMLLLPFVAASIVGRGTRFFLVAAVVTWGGPGFDRHLKRYVDAIGWILVLLGILAYLLLRD